MTPRIILHDLRGPLLAMLASAALFLAPGSVADTARAETSGPFASARSVAAAHIASGKARQRRCLRRVRTRGGGASQRRTRLRCRRKARGGARLNAERPRSGAAGWFSFSRGPLVAPLVSGGGGGLSRGAPAPSPPSTPSLLGRRVGVTARELSLTLSRPLVAAGPVTIELRNGGEDPHDLVLEDDDAAEVGRFAELAPGGLVSQSVVLPAGTYQLFCSLPGHRAAGMKAMLKAG